MSKEIRIERFYPHPIAEVWRAIATREALAAWLMPNDFELKQGHVFQFRTRPQPGFDGIVHCEVIDFSAPTLLQYTWRGGSLRKPTLVTFRLREEAGGTRLTFTHSGFEGFINAYIVRFILGSGWRNLLSKKIKSYLSA